LVTSVAAVLVVLIAGIVISTIFAVGQFRARAEAMLYIQITKEADEYIRGGFFAKGPETTIREALDTASKNLEYNSKFLEEQFGPRVEALMRGALGTTYLGIGLYKEAEPHMECAHQFFRDEFGEENRGTLWIMGNLALLYQQQKRYEEAGQLYVKVLETQRRVLGEEDPGTLTAMYNLVSLYKDQERYEEAELLLVKTLEDMRRGGEAYSLMRVPIDKLASLYKDQGRYEEAGQLYVKALETARRVLGEEDPQTLTIVTAISNLGVEQYRAGAYQNALVTLTRIRRLRQTAFKQSKASDVAFIAMALHQLGRTQEAQAVLEQLRDLFEDDKQHHEQSYLQEAEQLLAGENSRIYLVWECIETERLEEARQLLGDLKPLPTQKGLEIDGGIQSVFKALAWAYCHRGKSHNRRGEYDKAIGDYETAVRGDPGYAPALNNLGWLLATCP
ncbi:unnamed protein product, partial [marine sediment metagenome]